MTTLHVDWFGVIAGAAVVLAYKIGHHRGARWGIDQCTKIAQDAIPHFRAFAQRSGE